MQVFEKAFARSPMANYQREWKDLKGGFSMLVTPKAPYIPEGNIISSVDEVDRRLLIRGTRLGNVVVYERYKQGHGPKMLFCNLPGIFLARCKNKPIGTFEDALNMEQVKYLIEGNI